jgi:hypothetical protein
VADSSYALLINNEGQRAHKFAALYQWKRNPLFYAALLTALFSCATLLIHAVWGFTLGISLSLFTLVVSAWLLAAIVDHYPVAPRSVSSWVKLKAGFFVLFFVAIFAGLVYVQVLQLEVYIAAGARDGDAWTAFPDACRATPPQAPPLNCIRAGVDIPNALAAPGMEPIRVPLFATSLPLAAEAFRGILAQRTDFRDCHLLSDAHDMQNGTYFLHWRCLTAFLGFPDDFAIQLSCSDGSVRAWFHSQSRLEAALFDHGVNDARVRLALNYALLPTDWWPFSGQLNSTSPCM